jgi:hypothetical protein
MAAKKASKKLQHGKKMDEVKPLSKVNLQDLHVTKQVDKGSAS